ncbi:fused D-xylose transporter subunits of ABC superfamily: ATP-binding components [Petrocella atlantisensis]|uniref:Fused D-xylose transporter subunits of ABC superfamily: ATP-binding components n=1 Tax=Petrocella atlantisensis TaxID=2173034 RepID=A0A3P7PXT1_9FIRM|nr:sugar ABC transporter ATP-binding protein [Petrocella atlantisensis]MCF8020146.1 sugar ABC transporter ATP-binding protein [Vallitaleaceae bacterium]VDN48457.1 fused D-xylose transporter subunits of ABC superfamily: ATP-binding components [Petrocella atlantisensis]
MANILEMRNITKEFPGVKALDQVNFEVEEGEIHCLVGENGAGKSTLMKVLSGVYPYGTYSGDIVLNNEVQNFSRISDSEKKGVAIIYQELALIPDLSVYENIFLGHEIQKRGIVNWHDTKAEAAKMLKKVKLEIHPASKIIDLGVGVQQLIEIAKALSKEVKLLILDEPTAALNESDSENLLELLKDLKKQGVTSIMISHKLKEVIAIADTVTVLRDGKTICSLKADKGEVNEKEIIKYMVGREINDIFPKRLEKNFGEVQLEVKNWSAFDRKLGRHVVKDANFNVRKGEIVGIAGLMGAGRTEFALSIFGNSKSYDISGEVLINNQLVSLKKPKDAIDNGLAYVSEDRKGNGLILIQDIKQNITVANLSKLSNYMVVNKNEEIEIAEKYRESMNIKTPSIEQKVMNLSGGNQQKVALSKWLFVEPNVLILDEPTRGIDVGAKYEIYTIMNELVTKGLSIIMISSELPEVLGMSDRVYVMAEGRLTGELPIEEATQEKIMEMATV